MRSSDVLTALLYGLDLAMRPTLTNLTGFNDAWIADYGLRQRDFGRLAKEGLIDGKDATGTHWIGALTKKGRLQALGGRDPDERWRRTWDGRWRMLLFDIAQTEGGYRRKLLRWLHANHFGALQQSVWIFPDTCEELTELITDQSESANAVTIVESTACIGGGDADLVSAAWDFDTINDGYRTYLEFLALRRTPPKNRREGFAWANEERERWETAARRDPMLPNALLPSGYLGGKAWARRQQTIARTRRSLSKLSE